MTPSPSRSSTHHTGVPRRPPRRTGARNRCANVAPSTGPSSPRKSSDPSPARCPQGRRPRKGHGGGDGAVGQRGEQHLALGVVGTGGQHGGGEHGGERRTGHHRPGHLLHHDGQLQHAEALAAVLLGHVDAQPALTRQLVPERRHRLGLGVEQGTGHLGWAARLEPPPHGAAQLLVVLPDADGHPRTPCPSPWPSPVNRALIPVYPAINR